MQVNTTANDLTTLDSLFCFNRDNKKINALRKQVEAFEKNVKQRAKILEQEERLRREKMNLDIEIILKSKSK